MPDCTVVIWPLFPLRMRKRLEWRPCDWARMGGIAEWERSWVCEGEATRGEKGDAAYMMNHPIAAHLSQRVTVTPGTHSTHCVLQIRGPPNDSDPSITTGEDFWRIKYRVRLRDSEYLHQYRYRLHKKNTSGHKTQTRRQAFWPKDTKVTKLLNACPATVPVTTHCGIA